ncbi:Trafficking protein particle complex subunit 13 [Cryptotermes secundus]|uniref:Trafficking protein particle complex subunit 13 n=1 Tax=Cryptotermes secundus TaxID=105785 RepID=A0A2J7PU27_9NEOP|nr:trafficking protein particle complex subunit 13 isoform X2 [Cryptotermes secundus]PNF19837.1 Trafficking protein particle complex subunit 13 [Cryptotermes secundus]
MEGRDTNEHLLALKVMRLTRPTLCSPAIVTSDSKDLPGNLLNNDLKNDITSVPGIETLAAGQFLLLPQSFGNIYLGETFSSYICVHNYSSQVAKHVSVKADLQTSSQRIPLSGHQMESVAAELHPQDILDDIIHHEVREVGTHILVCEVNYMSPTQGQLTFRKFFKFQVLKPLDVKWKFYNAESDEVYLEAQVQNITTSPICLEKVSLESSHLFNVTALNTTMDEESVFGHVNVLQPQASRQFLYCLAPQASLTSDLRLLTGATNIGKLDIVWRSNLGERGRLQTSQLQRMAPDYGDIRLSIQELPNIIHLEEAFTFTCRIINACERSMDLLLSLETPPSSGLVWSGVSGRQMGKLEPGASIHLPLCMVPLATGLQNISGIRLTDVFLKRTYDYDDLAQVFVTQATA